MVEHPVLNPFNIKEEEKIEKNNVISFNSHENSQSNNNKKYEIMINWNEKGKSDELKKENGLNNKKKKNK